MTSYYVKWWNFDSWNFAPLTLSTSCNDGVASNTMEFFHLLGEILGAEKFEKLRVFSVFFSGSKEIQVKFLAATLGKTPAKVRYFWNLKDVL